MDDQTVAGNSLIIARRAGQVPVIAVIGRRDISVAAPNRMGVEAVHAIADRTDANPAADPGPYGLIHSPVPCPSWALMGPELANRLR